MSFPTLQHRLLSERERDGKGQSSVLCANAEKAGNGGWVSHFVTVPMGCWRPEAPGGQGQVSHHRRPELLVSPAAQVGKGELTSHRDPAFRPLTPSRYPQWEGSLALEGLIGSGKCPLCPSTVPIDSGSHRNGGCFQGPWPCSLTPTSQEPVELHLLQDAGVFGTSAASQGTRGPGEADGA